MSSDDTHFCAAPGILISVPQLQDPNFVRSVVAMFLHNEEGALGLVINRPTPLLCTDVLEQFDLEWHGDPEAALLAGGPVNRDAVWMIHSADTQFEDTLLDGKGLALSRSQDALSELFEHKVSPLLLGVGYAGWSPGQLEEEIAHGAWINSEIASEIVFDCPHDEMWDTALRQMGIDPALLVLGGGMQ